MDQMNFDKNEFIEKLKDDEFCYVKQFDTVQLIRKVLSKGYSPKTNYPIKKIDVSTMFLIAYYPYKYVGFYSERLNLENGSFSYIVKKLEQLELIEVVKDKYDKRKKVLVLTKNGEEETLKLRGDFNIYIQDQISVLEDMDKQLLFESLENLRNLALKMKGKLDANKWT